MDIIKVKIGQIPFSLIAENNKKMMNILKQHYRDFTTTGRPRFSIRVILSENIQEPQGGKLLFRTKEWGLGYKSRHLYFLAFAPEGRRALAWIKYPLNITVNFYTQDPNGQLVMYLFPQILYGLISPQFNSLLLHACGVVEGKKAYLFVAPSYGGKSTIAKLAGKRMVLNDDRILIYKEREGYKICGTPWYGEIYQTANISMPIQNIFFLKKAKINRLIVTSKAENLMQILKHSFYLDIYFSIIENKMKEQIFEIITQMVNELNCYQFYFKQDASIWKFLDAHIEQNP